MALPYQHNSPSSTSQLRSVKPVSLDIALQLRFPIRDPRFWNPAINASFVLVPETPLDEDDSSPRRKYEIGDSGQFATVQDVTIPEPVEQAADLHLRPGVGTPDPAHDLAAARETFLQVRVADRFPSPFSKDLISFSAKAWQSV